MRVAIAGAVVATAVLAGGAAGHLTRPVPDAAEADVAPEVQAPPAPIPQDALDAVPFTQPFVVPILRDGQVWSHAVLGLGIESAETPREAILAREPRLRDALNHALWTHAALGGFDGDFTALDTMDRLRERLDAVAVATLDDPTARVLLTAMTRQSN